MKLCPLLKKACIEHQCRWFIQIQGSNPQTGVTVSEWACAIEFIPLLIIEGSQQTRGVAASIESARNESVNSAHQVVNALMTAARPVIEERQTYEALSRTT